MSVLEYSPIAEILGAYPLANYAMNCSYVERMSRVLCCWLRLVRLAPVLT